MVAVRFFLLLATASPSESICIGGGGVGGGWKSSADVCSVRIRHRALCSSAYGAVVE